MGELLAGRLAEEGCDNCVDQKKGRAKRGYALSVMIVLWVEKRACKKGLRTAMIVLWVEQWENFLRKSRLKRNWDNIVCQQRGVRKWAMYCYDHIV